MNTVEFNVDSRQSLYPFRFSDKQKILDKRVLIEYTSMK